MTKNVRGKLAQFKKTHPKCDVFVQQHIVGFCRVYPVTLFTNTVAYNNPIDTFSRDRDAWRRLRSLGYTREGNKWRLIPKAEQEPLIDNEHAFEK